MELSQFWSLSQIQQRWRPLIFDVIGRCLIQTKATANHSTVSDTDIMTLWGKGQIELKVKYHVSMKTEGDIRRR